MTDKFCQKDCPYCAGNGYVGYDVPMTDYRYGKLYKCPLWCRQHWHNSLGIEEGEGATLDWSVFMPTKLMTVAVPVMKDLLNTGMGWLYIHGVPGVGKTHVIKASVLQAWYMYGHSARYTTEMSLINYFRTSFGGKLRKNEYDERMKEMVNLDFLAIDEIGRDRGTDFAIAAFSELLDKRYTRALGQRSMTVFGSNFAPEKVMDDYQVDRIRDGRFMVLEFAGPSVRPLMKRQPSKANPYWWYRALLPEKINSARTD